MENYSDWCADCVAYGDDYYTNDEGELECRCPACAFNDNEDECCD